MAFTAGLISGAILISVALLIVDNFASPKIHSWICQVCGQMNRSRRGQCIRCGERG